MNIFYHYNFFTKHNKKNIFYQKICSPKTSQFVIKKKLNNSNNAKSKQSKWWGEGKKSSYKKPNNSNGDTTKATILTNKN